MLSLHNRRDVMHFGKIPFEMNYEDKFVASDVSAKAIASLH